MSTDDKITTNCPACNAQLQVASKYAGKSLRCPKCHAAVTVPGTKGDNPLSPRLPDDIDPAVGQDVGPKQLVVRYAPDVISQPMSSDELLKALADGKLLPEMLFAEVGSESWQPLTFVSPLPMEKRRQTIALRDRFARQYLKTFTLQYVLAVLILVGVIIALLSTTTGSDDAIRVRFIAGIIISAAVWGLIFLWVNRFFQEVLLLLRRIADFEDEEL